jgi:hypothetical protein
MPAMRQIVAASVAALSILLATSVVPTTADDMRSAAE